MFSKTKTAASETGRRQAKSALRHVRFWWVLGRLGDEIKGRLSVLPANVRVDVEGGAHLWEFR